MLHFRPNYYVSVLLEQIAFSNEPHKSLTMPGGSNDVDIVVFQAFELIFWGQNSEQSNCVRIYLSDTVLVANERKNPTYISFVKYLDLIFIHRMVLT